MQIQCLLNDVEAGKYFIDTFEVIHGEGLEIGDMVKIMNGSYRGQIGFLDIVREGKKRGRTQSMVVGKQRTLFILWHLLRAKYSKKMPNLQLKLKKI